jgi:hypothetical protein
MENNIVNKLLKLDARKITELPKEKFEVKRLSKIMGEKFEVELSALDSETYSEIQKSAINFSKGTVKELDIYKMQMLSLTEGIKSPDLGNKELQKHFGEATKKGLISKLFLSGEIAEMYQVVSKLSGYDSEEIDSEEIKN